MGSPDIACLSEAPVFMNFSFIGGQILAVTRRPGVLSRRR